MPSSSPKSPIKAIIFDFGGVVVPGIFLEYVKKLSTNDPKYILFKESSQKWDLGELSVDQFYLTLSQLMGIPHYSKHSNYYANAAFNEDIIKIIKTLKKSYKVALFTNNFSYHLYQYLNRRKLNNLFHKLIISSEHKMVKPNPAFYHKMLSLININSNEAIFIDDSKENVDAGNALGITSFLFTDTEKLKKDLKSKGVIV